MIRTRSETGLDESVPIFYIRFDVGWRETEIGKGEIWSPKYKQVESLPLFSLPLVQIQVGLFDDPGFARHAMPESWPLDDQHRTGRALQHLLSDAAV